MKILDNQNGTSHLIGLLALVAILAIGAVGIRVFEKNSTKNDESSSQTAIPESITNKSQIRQADKALDAEEIDTTLDASQLDDDINALQ